VYTNKWIDTWAGELAAVNKHSETHRENEYYRVIVDVNVQRLHYYHHQLLLTISGGHGFSYFHKLLIQI